jgi:hypothetical protein
MSPLFSPVVTPPITKALPARTSTSAPISVVKASRT